jgi:hypothetical protein
MSWPDRLQYVQRETSIVFRGIFSAAGDTSRSFFTARVQSTRR